jgi:very-short-patch-repair endonuclease
MPLVHNNEKLKDRRRDLRRRSTKEEEILWSNIRGNKLGYKFKRQHSIGGYILDFYCSECKLIIEIDGVSHNTKEAREYDKIRDTYFKELGYTTIRFLNMEVKNEIEKVLLKIKYYLVFPSPSQGEGQG